MPFSVKRERLVIFLNIYDFDFYCFVFMFFVFKIKKMLEGFDLSCIY